MSFNNLQQKNSEIEQFLLDVREHLKSSLETSEYENSSNIFYVTEAETTAKLLQRCEVLLQKCGNIHGLQEQKTVSIQSNLDKPRVLINSGDDKEDTNELDVNYLDMTGTYCKKKSASHEYIFTGSEKTYRCSASLADICDEKCNDTNSITYQTINKSIKESLKPYAHESFQDEEDSEIYDTCVVSQYSLDSLETASSCDDCPFMNLPACHLATHKSSKYGPLQRIEKRLFFDQCKKCYCGILNDWLLCYVDSAAYHPNYFLYLKAPAIQIEHFGEGKRRDICFQLTTGDPNYEKIIFQASNEVDAKEWIHAIEAVRSDLKKNRRLPTPPIMKKITFFGHGSENKTNSLTPSLTEIGATTSLEQIDRIYEEPSPIYDLRACDGQVLQNFIEKSDENPNLEFYDIPKSPPKPVETTKPTQNNKSDIGTLQHSTKTEIPAETSELLNTSSQECTSSPTNSQKIRQSLVELADKIDFQAKVKDLHSKLSSQLLSAHTSPSQKLSLRKTYSDSSNDLSESVALTTSATIKDEKKQKHANSSNLSNNNDNEKQNNNVNEKPTKSWFLTRFQKTTSSMRSSVTPPTFAKCRQSEKENLLNGPDSAGEQIEANSITENKSKVSMIINRLEASGGRKAMISMETMTSLSDCNTYEPMMTVSSTPNRFLKKI